MTTNKEDSLKELEEEEKEEINKTQEEEEKEEEEEDKEGEEEDKGEEEEEEEKEEDKDKGKLGNLLGKIKLGKLKKEEFDLGESFLTDFEQGNFIGAFEEFKKLVQEEKGEDFWEDEIIKVSGTFQEDLLNAEEEYKRFLGEIQENFTEFTENKNKSLMGRVNMGNRVNDFAIIVPSKENNKHITMEELMENILKMSKKTQYNNMLITPVPMYLDKDNGEGIIILTYGGGWNVRLKDFTKSVKLTKDDLKHIKILEFDKRIEIRLAWIILIRQLRQKYTLVSKGEEIPWSMIQSIFIHQRYRFIVKDGEIKIIDKENPSEDKEEDTIKAEWDKDIEGEDKNNKEEKEGKNKEENDIKEEGNSIKGDTKQVEIKEEVTDDRPPLSPQKEENKENEVHPGYSFD